MYKLKIKGKDMKHIVPVEDWIWEKERKNPPPLNASFRARDLLVQRNGGEQIYNLINAHDQLKDLLILAVVTAREQQIPLNEVEVVCPQLMDASTWGGYMGSPWSAERNSNTLREWFDGKFGREFVFHINANGNPCPDKKPHEVHIKFSKRLSDTQSHCFTA